MEQTIQKMLRTEDEARKLVQEAEEGAKRAVATAQQESDRKRVEAVQSAREQGRKLLDETVKAAQQEKVRLLEQKGREIEAGIKVDPARIREAAAWGQKVVTAQE